MPMLHLNLNIKILTIETGPDGLFLSCRYRPGQVYLEKDLILPYVANLDLCDDKCLSETNPKRNTLLFFRGRLKRNAVSMVLVENMEEILYLALSNCLFFHNFLRIGS